MRAPRRILLAFAALALAACGGKPPITGAMPEAGGNTISGGPVALLNNNWMTVCFPLPQGPHAGQRLCAAALRFGGAALPYNGVIYTLTGRSWTIGMNVPMTAASVQVEGSPNTHVARCDPRLPLCSFDAQASAQLTQELQSGRTFTLTVQGARGQAGQRAATSGFADALRAAAAGTAPGVPVDVLPPPSSVGVPVGRPLTF
ncbi:hypothetical protein EOD42_10460 [Rhodovarius crocodyli]|uniref:Uncharacterized protein n=1 Tax=Rhodovarius crocodyli TaxID=1979269 RepID=A0A437MGN9_9PROT|nr:hypothetical protein [Rhodovarius crocodyli]RVT96820.1 hypothetical protein EOD42_10460 [Rhodovarius crocodyli]